MGSSRKLSQIEEEAQAETRRTVLFILNHGTNALVKFAIALVFAAAIFYGTRAAYRFGYSVFTGGTAEEPPGRDVEITIPEGMTARNIGVLLEKNGLVKDSRIFLVQAKIYGYTLLPGTYLLNTSETIAQMLTTLSKVPETGST